MGQPTPLRPLALIVEDDATQRELLSDLLEDSDYAIIGCDKAESAEAVLREQGDRIALLFADVNLAGQMSGAELAHVARQHNPDMEIVITSGRPLVEPLPDGVKFWQKPWARLDLIRQAATVHLATEPPAA